MSAFVHDKRHIDHLVTALIHAELITTSPDETGRMLWRENLRSVAYRYPGDQDGERPAPADFRDADVDTYTWQETPLLTGAALATACRSYAYQACVHPAWDESEAKRLMTALNAPVAALPLDDEYWEIR